MKSPYEKQRIKMYSLADEKKAIIFGITYTIIFVIVAGINNYYSWSPDPLTNQQILSYSLLWGTLYLPIPIYMKIFKWKLADFGFILKPQILLYAVISIPVLIGWNSLVRFSFPAWYTPIIEAVARFGEEVFFRGFLYTICIAIFKNKKRPWLWAILLSSIAFTMTHTQTLLADYHTDLLNIFVLSILFSAFRFKTGSILAGVVVHCALQAGLPGAIYGVMIYTGFIFIAFLMGEKPFSGFT